MDDAALQRQQPPERRDGRGRDILLEAPLEAEVAGNDLQHVAKALACDADQGGRAGSAGAAVLYTVLDRKRLLPPATVAASTYLMTAPERIHAPSSVRSSSVIPVAFPSGITRDSTATRSIAAACACISSGVSSLIPSGAAATSVGCSE